MTRILHVLTRGDTIAGAQRHVLDLASSFERTEEVAIASSFADGPLAQAAASQSTPFYAVESLRPGAGLKGAVEAHRELRAVVDMFRPDLVHAHSTKAGLLARAVARRCGVPAVFSAHGWAFTAGVPAARRTAGLALELAGRSLGADVLCATKVDMALARKLHVVPEKRLHLVGCAIPDIPGNRRPPAPRNEVPVASMVARFERQKDHESLLRGLALVKDLPWRMVLVGDGPLRPAMEALAVELGIADRVDFAGFSDDTPGVISASDLFVLVTKWEGLPLSVLEALRAGRPVVGTAVGGIPEAVIPGETGWLAEHSDVESVARALRAALDDPEGRLRAGERARALFEAQFTQEGMVGRIARVYDEVRSRR